MKVYQITADVGTASGVGTFVRWLNAALCDVGVSSAILTKVPMPQEDSGLPDIVHIHGMWLRLHHSALNWARMIGAKVVWSTHGMTAPWSMRHKRWKKLPAWLLYQKRDLMKATVIHCTADQEVEWNRLLGFDNCFVAPLGAYLPPLVQIPASGSKEDNQSQTTTSTHDRYFLSGNHTLLFVGRIYPVKGLANLIRAWKILDDTDRPALLDWKLRIVGPDQAGHRFELESLVRKFKLSDRIAFVGPKFGEELGAEYKNCDCLVLPSFTENFGATIVDALAYCKPCIASTFTPWRELQVCGCGWWVPNEPTQLALAIKEMMSLDDDERRVMGYKGRKLVEDKYSWNAVAGMMAAKYREICYGGATYKTKCSYTDFNR